MSALVPHPPRYRPLLWADEVLDLQERLLDFMPDVPLYLVGGAVRDALLHRPVHDLDLVVPQKAVTVARKLANALNGEIFVMDSERGVARVYLTLEKETRLVLDITQFRGADLLADLQGRDFTINAIAVDFRGDMSLLIDPLDGEVDLQQKRLRTCSDDALAQDPLRALRAARLSAQFGYRIEANTQAQVRAVAPRLAEVSPERLRDEFFKLLGQRSAPAALRVAHALGVLAQVLPFTARLAAHAPAAPYTQDGWAHTLDSIERLLKLLEGISYRRTDTTATTFGLAMLVLQLDRFRAALNEHLDAQWANDRSHSALLVLGALCQLAHHVDPTQSAAAHGQAVAEGLRLSNPEKKRLSGMLAYYERFLFLDATQILEVHRFWHYAEQAGVDAVLLAAVHKLAMHSVMLDHRDWLAFVEKVVIVFTAYFRDYARVVAPPPLLNGNDLMNTFALTSGRIIGQLLDEIRERQVTGELTTRDEAFAFVRRFLDLNQLG